MDESTEHNPHTELIDQYVDSLLENTPESSLIECLETTVPTAAKSKSITTLTNGLSYRTALEPWSASAVLGIVDSPAGHKADVHEVYVETKADAQRVFTELLESHCLTETIVEIHYPSGLGDSDFVQFVPDGLVSRSGATLSETPASLFIKRLSEPSTSESPDSLIGFEPLLDRFRCWLANYTGSVPEGPTKLSRRLSSVDGLEKVTKLDSEGQLSVSWQLANREWTVE
jgi:hypothetical protein